MRILPLCLILTFVPLRLITAQELDVPFYVTEPEVVEGMLDMANVGPGDYLIDLGSGDGRIVIAAARRGAVGHGVDLDPQRNIEANRNAREAGVHDRVFFLEEDLFKTDFSQATVVTMFLLSAVNLRLRPMLLSRLRPGTRVLSHTFDMGDWEPDKRKVIGIRPVYLWVIPARVDGDWEWNNGNIPFTMTIKQEYQEISVSLMSGKESLKIESAELTGERMTIHALFEKTGIRYLFSGSIHEEIITGYVQIHSDDAPALETWSASRRQQATE
jgi:SAM-dependent methyltransferase